MAYTGVDTDECDQAIWENRSFSLRNCKLAEGRWAAGVQGDMLALDNVLSWPDNPSPPFPLVALIMMIKDEADILEQNLSWHYHIGIRRFILNDNNSNDDSLQIIMSFRDEKKDAEVLILSDPLIRYMQSEKMTGLFDLARAIWPDLLFIFPVDADEFVVPSKGLEALDTVPSNVDALTLSKVVHYIDPDHEEKEDVFLRMPCRSEICALPPKVAVRARAGVQISQGNHQVFLWGRSAFYASGGRLGLYMREFPVRSREHLHRKIINGGRAIDAAERFLGRDVGGQHWKDAYKSYVESGSLALDRLYNYWLRKADDADIFLDRFHVPGRKEFRKSVSGGRGEIVPASHPDWVGSLHLFGDGTVVHVQTGNAGSFQRKGDALLITWDKFGQEVFLWSDGSYRVAKVASASNIINIEQPLEAHIGGQTLDIKSVDILQRGGLAPITLRTNTSDSKAYYQVFVEKQYDASVLPAEASTIIDLGANIGLSALFFAERYPRARIICLEPDPDNFRQLSRNAAPHSDRIEIVNAAIWSKDTMLSLQTVDENNEDLGAWGARVSAGDNPGIRAMSMETLLDFYNIDFADILKIDIEGAEVDLFERSINAWSRRVGLIFIETHDRFRPGGTETVKRALASQFVELPPSGENLVFKARSGLD